MSEAGEPRVGDGEILAVFANSDRALRSEEVAAELPLDHRDAGDRLDDLHERGLLDVEETTRGEVWRLTADGEGAVAADDVETDVEAQTEGEGEPTAPPEREERAPPEHADVLPEPDTRPEEPTTADERVEDAIAAFDTPGDPREQEARREALRAAYTYLRKRATAERRDFETDVFPRHPARYEDPDEGWWEEVVRPGLADLPNVEPRGGDTWRYTGGEARPDR